MSSGSGARPLGVASLSHPNIVQVYDRGVSEDGRYYIAMEYVPGDTLKDRIVGDGPLPPRVAVAVAVQIADALLSRGDVKPQNVLVTASGDVKVADFGIARAAAADVISATSTVLGTASYTPPEQAMTRGVGSRATATPWASFSTRCSRARCPSRPTRRSPSP